jgi:hypothetical protein
MKLSDLDATARRQRGLVTLDQWTGAGGSRAGWYRALDDGRLLSAHPGVARLPGTELDPMASILAALLAVNGTSSAPKELTAVPSHTSAAALLGGGTFDGTVHLTLVRPGARPRLDGVALHRPRDAGAIRLVNAGGMWVTDPARTVIDCAAVLDLPRLGSLIEALLLSRRLSLQRLEHQVAGRRRQGDKGAADVHRLLAEVGRWAKPPDSLLEVRFAELLAAHGLPAATLHHTISAGGRTVELDFAYLGGRAPIDLEVDGWASHGSPRAFEGNRERDGWVQAEGWVVQRFTWFQVTQRPDFVAGIVRGLLVRHRHPT